MNAQQDFHRNFPAARGIPNRFNRQRQKQRTRPTPYFIPPSTWTHDFFLLNKTTVNRTPERHLIDHLNSCGLGRKKIVFSDKNGDHKHIRETLESHFPKLVEQNGAFQLLKSLSGGSGVRNLVPVMIPPGGYTVSDLKDQCKSSLIYIKPLQKDIELAVQQENAIEKSSSSCSVCVVCKRCNSEVELNKFEQHSAACKENYRNDDVFLPPTPGFTKSETIQSISHKELFDQLKEMELDFNEDDLKSVAETSLDVNEALDKLFSSASASVHITSTPSTSFQVSSSSTSTSSSSTSSCTQIEEPITDFNTVLSKFQKRHLQNENYKLTVCREEVWKTGLTFYKKALINPDILKKDLEVNKIVSINRLFENIYIYIFFLPSSLSLKCFLDVYYVLSFCT